MDESAVTPSPPPPTRDASVSGFAIQTRRSSSAAGAKPFDDAYVIVKDSVAPGGASRLWRGYVVFRKGEDSAIARWHGGDCRAPKPDAELEGSWRFVAGTGRFGEIRGGGTFEAREAEPGQFAFEWKGRFELGLPAAPRPAARRRSARAPA